MPRPCLICSNTAKSARAAELIAAGNSDQAVANALNAMKPSEPPMSLMAVNRHRRAHILKVVQDQIAIVSKGSAARQGREQLAAAAASGAPSTEDIVAAAIGLAAQVTKLAAIESRLERMATIAEAGGSATGVAVLAAQQMRGIETGSKLAGLPGFAPARAVEGAGGGSPFNVVIQFSGGETVSISPTQTAVPPNTIDTEPDDEGDSPDDNEVTLDTTHIARLARAFGVR